MCVCVFVCPPHRACLDLQVPFDSTWQQEQLSLGAPPSLHTHDQSEGECTVISKEYIIRLYIKRFGGRMKYRSVKNLWHFGTKTNQHRFEFHVVGILHTSAILKSPPQVLLTGLGNTCGVRRAASKLISSLFRIPDGWMDVWLLHLGTEPQDWNTRPAGTSAETASWRPSSGGRPPGCRAASILSDNCPYTKHKHTTTNEGFCPWTMQVPITASEPVSRKHGDESYGLELVLVVTCFITWQ